MNDSAAAMAMFAWVSSNPALRGSRRVSSIACALRAIERLEPPWTSWFVRRGRWSHTEAGDDASQQKLYKLIWRRTLASQMAAAETERSEIIISIDGNKHKLVAKGEILKFDGFYKVYGGGKKLTFFSNIKNGEPLKFDYIKAI